MTESKNLSEVEGVQEMSESKNLLEVEGVQEMLAKIIVEAEKNSAEIVEAVNKYLAPLDEKQRENDLYTILRELKGMCVKFFGESKSSAASTAFEKLAATCKDQKKVDRISWNYKSAICPDDSTILKNICPGLF